jgi:hypothetical protein
VTTSGKPAASAAPNNEERISPAATVQRTDSGAASALATKPALPRTIGQALALAVDEPQRREPAPVVGFDRDPLAESQLVDRSRGGIGAQELQRVGIVDAESRQHAADGVTAPNALLAPVTNLRLVNGRQRRQLERARDHAGRHGLDGCAGRDSEGGGGGECQGGDRQPLAG